jgi:hypothetical protein
MDRDQRADGRNRHGDWDEEVSCRPMKSILWVRDALCPRRVRRRDGCRLRGVHRPGTSCRCPSSIRHRRRRAFRPPGRRHLCSSSSAGVTITVPCLESRGITGAQHLLAGVAGEDHLARKHINKLVRCRVPMTLAGPRTWWKAQEVDAELRQPGHITELPAFARTARLVEWRWIKCPDDRGHRCDINSLFHDRTHSAIPFDHDEHRARSLGTRQGARSARSDAFTREPAATITPP